MSIRIEYKQYPIPSSSQKVPYSISVPIRNRKDLTSLDLYHLIKQMRADILFLSYRRFDFLTARKVNVDSIFALYGKNCTFNKVLPTNYRYFADRNNNISIGSTSFDSLRKQFCHDFHLVMDVLINKNIEIISKSSLNSVSENELIHEIEKLFDLDSRLFRWQHSLQYRIDNVLKTIDFKVDKKLDRNLTLNALRMYIRKPAKEHHTQINIFDGEPAMMSYSIRKD